MRAQKVDLVTPKELAELNAWDVARRTDPEPLASYYPRLRCIPTPDDVRWLLCRYTAVWDLVEHKHRRQRADG